MNESKRGPTSAHCNPKAPSGSCPREIFRGLEPRFRAIDICDGIGSVPSAPSLLESCHIKWLCAFNQSLVKASRQEKGPARGPLFNKKHALAKRSQ